MSCSSGYGAILLDAEDLKVHVVIMSDDSVYIGLAGGYLVWSGTGLVHGSSWPIRMVGDTSSFTETTEQKRDLYSPQFLDDISSFSSTYAYYTLPTLPKPTIGKAIPSEYKGYKCSKKVTKWSKVGGKANVRKYYLAFPASNDGGDVNQIEHGSTEIIFTSDIFVPDYFPGKIKHADSGDQWDSCNRSGGYFKIKGSSSWVDRKNRSGDLSGSKVILNDGASKNNGWNTIAPKIGTGA